MLHLSSGPSAGRARGITGSTLVVLLVSAVPVQADPPWAVESPAAVGARFGLGLDALFEHQESLRIDAQESVVSLTTEGGEIRTDVVDGDPDLLNRKFDLEWELKGPGVEVPLALPSFRLTGLIEVFPALTLEAASVDVTLDSISKTESNPKVSLQGRGSFFGAKLGATASLCGDCPWFNGTSYHYRSLPAFEADRSPTFAEPGFEVLHDEVRLSQEVHEVSTKFGYLAPNQRVAYYTGVRTRWTDVEIEDELRVVADQQREMDLSTNTTLGSETVQVVAGMNARLIGSVFGNLEVASGDGDEQILLRMVFMPLRHSLHTTEEHRHEIERFTAIAGLLIPQLARILDQFRAEWQALTVVEGADGQPAYLAAEVDALLLRNETALLDLFGQYQDLLPLADWVRDRFREVRVDLGLEPAKVASLSFQIARGRRALSKIRTDQNNNGIIKSLQKIVDRGKFWTRFEFILEEEDNESLGPDYQIAVYPKYKWEEGEFMRTLPPGGFKNFVYGDYSFRIYHREKGTRFRLCNALSKVLTEQDAPCPLEFMNRPKFVLRCGPKTGCKEWGERK